MFLRRCAFGCFWIVLGLFALNHPENAARAVRAIFTGLALLADGLSRLVSAF
ncbi:hypothetical protein E1293_31235 [Actinomadura darangshiensis]|uniref:Uncharacterized protein n=1 Tax=Actinomadura darangshiensis TaxID=705336 RepID=A0A4R5ALB3_9ACTN|nr:DUF308 domain-containing protein [Actinomadura darangshiensis]TDD73481.1 hypothetical protein E1293_31235 [Actinomadura darangshiensis]